MGSLRHRECVERSEGFVRARVELLATTNFDGAVLDREKRNQQPRRLAGTMMVLLILYKCWFCLARTRILGYPRILLAFSFFSSASFCYVNLRSRSTATTTTAAAATILTWVRCHGRKCPLSKSHACHPYQ